MASGALQTAGLGYSSMVLLLWKSATHRIRAACPACVGVEGVSESSLQARFLLARLNPSSTYSTQTSMSAEMIMTDDVSLSVFTDHLRKLATSG